MLEDKLQDLLPPGLRVVFCGTAAGDDSAALGHYYAGPGNKFWDILFKAGLTPRRLRPDQWKTLVTYGIGLTDVAKIASGADSRVPKEAFDAPRMRASLRICRPSLLAFNGKTAARKFLGLPVRAPVDYGPLSAAEPGLPPMFVLPSTSGAANGHWDEQPWHDLARLIAVIPAAQDTRASC